MEEADEEGQWEGRERKITKRHQTVRGLRPSPLRVQISGGGVQFEAGNNI